MKVSVRVLVAMVFLSGGWSPAETETGPAVAATEGPAVEAGADRQPVVMSETREQLDQRMAWWREARFGLFIHFGLYTIPAGEWEGKHQYAEWIRHRARIPQATYERFLSQFDPVHFRGSDWVGKASEAGMKYMVVTAKHHDGFCLWPSELTDFDIAATPFKRDILGELKEACDRIGFKFGLYYSIMDWNHPDYPPRDWETDRRDVERDWDRYLAYMKGQLAELIERYDPAVLWFDGQWEDVWTHQEGVELYNYVRSLKPDIIINNRVDKGRTGEAGMTEDGFAGDFGTPEQEIPARGLPGVDWESCMTMNDHWGYARYDENWKSSKDLLRKLVDVVSKGGNLLLNVGPVRNGMFPSGAEACLRGMGDWMWINGESIHGAGASIFDEVPWGRITTRPRSDGMTLYLHVFEWPAEGRLLVPAPPGRVTGVTLFETQEPLESESTEEGLVVYLPATPLNPINTVIRVEVENGEKVPVAPASEGGGDAPVM